MRLTNTGRVAALAAVALAAACAPASAQITTGFEAPFVPGSINGQQGWQVTDASSAASYNISTLNPQTGAQSLRITDDTAVANGTQTGVFSPATGFTGNAATLTTFSLAITGVTPGPAGGADYDMVLQTATLLTAQINFSFLGDIRVAEDTDANGTLNAFVDTGANWTPGAFNTISVLTDVPNSIRRYFLNGSLIYTGAPAALAGATVEEAVLITDNFQVAGEAAYLDNFSVTAAPVAVPEPGALALLCVGALPLVGLIARRRAA